MAVDYTTPMTELDAINILLSAIGEAPITSIDDLAEQSPDAQIAQSYLAQSSKSLQSEGWPWNTDLNFTLTANPSTGEVALPEGCVGLKVLTCPGQYVQRGSRLYDRWNHTFNVGKPILCEAVTLLNFDELPQACRDLVTFTAARRFQDFIQQDNAVHQFTSEDLLHARGVLDNQSYEAGDLNMLNSSTTSIDLAYRYRGTVLR